METRKYLSNDCTNDKLARGELWRGAKVPQQCWAYLRSLSRLVINHLALARALSSCLLSGAVRSDVVDLYYAKAGLLSDNTQLTLYEISGKRDKIFHKAQGKSVFRKKM